MTMHPHALHELDAPGALSRRAFLGGMAAVAVGLDGGLLCADEAQVTAQAAPALLTNPRRVFKIADPG
ncbi:MAG TPA: hypothetical protein VF771_00095, partial [Longimicrobiaceae bacterium]